MVAQVEGNSIFSEEQILCTSAQKGRSPTGSAFGCCYEILRMFTAE